MSDCCKAGELRSTSWRGRCAELAGWAVQGVTIAFMPKCPACLAAYIALWTGVGLSFSMATYLRWTLMGLCAASFSYLVLRRVTAHFARLSKGRA